MGDTHRAFSAVDMLTARAAGAERLNAQVAFIPLLGSRFVEGRDADKPVFALMLRTIRTGANPLHRAQPVGDPRCHLGASNTQQHGTRITGMRARDAVEFFDVKFAGGQIADQDGY